MTTTTFEDARNMLGSAIDAAYESGTTNSGTIARIACGILQMLGSGNDDSVTIGDVVVSADTLARYVRKTLPAKGDAKPAEGMPTASALLAAFADLSDKVKSAEARLADHKAKAKKGDPLAVAEHNAKAERLTQSLNTARQPIRRALTLAAYVATAKDDDAMRYDLAACEVRDGVLWAAYATPRGDIAACPITFAHASEQVKPSSERAPNGQTKQTATATRTGVKAAEDGDLAAVTVTPEALKRGGEQRGNLGAALAAIAGMLGGIDGDVTATEREAIARLYVACERYLDADAMQRVADLRDEANDAA